MFTLAIAIAMPNYGNHDGPTSAHQADIGFSSGHRQIQNYKHVGPSHEHHGEFNHHSNDRHNHHNDDDHHVNNY